MINPTQTRRIATSVILRSCLGLVLASLVWALTLPSTKLVVEQPVEMAILKALDLPPAVLSQAVPCRFSAVDAWFRVRCPPLMVVSERARFLNHLALSTASYLLLFGLMTVIWRFGVRVVGRSGQR